MRALGMLGPGVPPPSVPYVPFLLSQWHSECPQPIRHCSRSCKTTPPLRWAMGAGRTQTSLSGLGGPPEPSRAPRPGISVGPL